MGTCSVSCRKGNDAAFRHAEALTGYRDADPDEAFRQNEEDEMKPCVVVLLSLLLMRPAIAAEGPPSEASIRELMQITQAQKLVEGTKGQVDGMVQTSMNKALEGRPVSAEQQKILDDMRAKMMAVLGEELDWNALEPVYIDIYTQSFTQHEIDGMIAFYKSEPGRAVLAKMPLVMQKTMQAMQTRMTSMMPKIEKIRLDAITQLKASAPARAN
jgi:hypothetical protein